MRIAEKLPTLPGPDRPVEVPQGKFGQRKIRCNPSPDSATKTRTGHYVPLPQSA
jgi:hypothetical protein